MGATPYMFRGRAVPAGAMHCITAVTCKQGRPSSREDAAEGNAGRGNHTHTHTYAHIQTDDRRRRSCHQPIKVIARRLGIEHHLHDHQRYATRSLTASAAARDAREAVGRFMTLAFTKSQPQVSVHPRTWSTTFLMIPQHAPVRLVIVQFAVLYNANVCDLAVQGSRI